MCIRDRVSHQSVQNYTFIYFGRTVYVAAGAAKKLNELMSAAGIGDSYGHNSTMILTNTATNARTEVQQLAVHRETNSN